MNAQSRPKALDIEVNEEVSRIIDGLSNVDDLYDIKDNYSWLNMMGQELSSANSILRAMNYVSMIRQKSFPIPREDEFVMRVLDSRGLLIKSLAFQLALEKLTSESQRYMFGQGFTFLEDFPSITKEDYLDLLIDDSIYIKRLFNES